MNHIGLFEGIGGFSLAARWMGWKTIAWCEINPFCQNVLKHHFPDAKAHSDITATDFTIYRGQCDILTGGFPCQPFSQSGLQQGENDLRYLFPEMLRAIREVKPRWIVAENVYGIVTKKFASLFQDICTSMEDEGYQVQTYNIPASAVGAPHERYRIWIVAYANGKYRQGGVYPDKPENAGCDIGAFNTRHVRETWKNFPTQSPLCFGDDGLSERLDGIAFSDWRNGSNKAGGNAIVPHLAYNFFQTIHQFEQQ